MKEKVTFRELIDHLRMLGVLPDDRIKEIGLDFSGGAIRGKIEVKKESDGWVIHNIKYQWGW